MEEHKKIVIKQDPRTTRSRSLERKAVLSDSLWWKLWHWRGVIINVAALQTPWKQVVGAQVTLTEHKGDDAFERVESACNAGDKASTRDGRRATRDEGREKGVKCCGSRTRVTINSSRPAPGTEVLMRKGLQTVTRSLGYTTCRCPGTSGASRGPCQPAPKP